MNLGVTTPARRELIWNYLSTPVVMNQDRKEEVEKKLLPLPLPLPPLCFYLKRVKTAVYTLGEEKMNQ